MNNNRNDLVFDFISVLSFIIGIENLGKNDEQINQLENHLKEQDNQYKEILTLLKDLKQGGANERKERNPNT